MLGVGHQVVVAPAGVVVAAMLRGDISEQIKHSINLICSHETVGIPGFRENSFIGISHILKWDLEH